SGAGRLGAQAHLDRDRHGHRGEGAAGGSPQGARVRRHEVAARGDGRRDPSDVVGHHRPPVRLLGRSGMAHLFRRAGSTALGRSDRPDRRRRGHAARRLAAPARRIHQAVRNRVVTPTPEGNMNIVLWILQIVLAFYGVSGGIWTLRMAPKLGAASTNTLPAPAWSAVAALQMLFGLGLVVPGAIGVMTGLTAIAAVGLAIVMVGSASIVLGKARTSVGMLWAVLPALAALFVAYGRTVLRPF